MYSNKKCGALPYKNGCLNKVIFYTMVLEIEYKRVYLVDTK